MQLCVCRQEGKLTTCSEACELWTGVDGVRKRESQVAAGCSSLMCFVVVMIRKRG